MVEMSQRAFKRLSTFIQEDYGIKMPAAKKVMLQARLQKRLRELDINSFEKYCDFVFSPEGQEHELVHMIDMVSTNKTDFFREPVHFDYLAQTALPELLKNFDNGRQNHFKIWSAGCSSGEEPYTLAMVLSVFKEKNPGFQFSILGTDISKRMLEKAKIAIYAQERITDVPFDLKIKYLMRSTDKNKKRVRIVPALRSLVTFNRLNFMDEDFGIRQRFNVIFCRNVIIYFDVKTQEKLLNKFCQQLVPGGYIFMGHSETLHNLNVPLVPVASTVYRKPKKIL